VVAAGTAAYFVPDLAHVLALCEDQLPVMELCEELARRGIHHSGSSLADAGAGLAVTILR
jgi:mediator of RNA polymerase II transcription subunit 14